MSEVPLILALAFSSKSLNLFKVSPFRSEADLFKNNYFAET